MVSKQLIVDSGGYSHNSSSVNLTPFTYCTALKPPRHLNYQGLLPVPIFSPQLYQLQHYAYVSACPRRSLSSHFAAPVVSMCASAFQVRRMLCRNDPILEGSLFPCPRSYPENTPVSAGDSRHIIVTLCHNIATVLGLPLNGLSAKDNRTTCGTVQYSPDQVSDSRN